MKNKIMLVIGLLALTGSICQLSGTTVQYNETDKSLNVVLDTTYLSKYINRGVFVGEHVIHSHLDVEYNKVYLAFNSYLGTQDKVIFDEEWDASLGVRVPNVLLEGLTVDLGVKGYFYPKGVISDTQEIYFGINTTFVGFDVSTYGYYDTDLETTNGEMSIGRMVNITEWLGWYTSAKVGFTDINNGPKYGYTETDTSIVVSINDSLSFTGGGSYRWSDDSDIFDINELVGYVTMTVAY